MVGALIVYIILHGHESCFCVVCLAFVGSAHYFAVLQSLLVGVAGGLSVGIGNYVTESVAVSICSWLEHHGVISRYIPDTKPFAEHPPSNIFAVGLPYIPLDYAISCAWPMFSSRAVMHYSPLDIWPFIVAAMLVHDTWFFAFHTMFHKFRKLYKHIHSMHHRLGASCSPFGNAYADALDIGLCFVSFHAALLLYLYYQPRWNPLAVVALIVVEVTTNIVGKLFISFYIQRRCI